MIVRAEDRTGSYRPLLGDVGVSPHPPNEKAPHGAGLSMISVFFVSVHDFPDFNDIGILYSSDVFADGTVF